MRKNLFLTCALALASFAGVQAQSWSHTVAQGLPGTQVVHDVNGTSVTQYRVETKLYNHAGTTGIRYTVLETKNTNGATGNSYGGGPFFAMGEMIVLDANGDTIPYTATSNADHNSGGAGTDGAGLPALNDGNFNNFFHSSWGGTEPGGFHHIELAFENSVDAFKLVWYTRPNQHVNRPSLVGLTPAGEEFTEPYGEYQYDLGTPVANIAELGEENAFFTFYADDLSNGQQFFDGETEITGPGSVYIALSGYNTGSSVDATPQNIVQLVPANGENTYVVYQPVLGTYYGKADKWTDGFNGSNGWQRATDVASALAEIKFTQRADGDYELSYEIEYEGQTVELWVGYEMRGRLKLFPADEKERLEAAVNSGDYTGGAFGLPVDFGFTIYKSHVADGVIEPISVKTISENVVMPTIEDARERIELYGDQEGQDQGELAALETAIADAEAAIENNDIAGIFAAKDNLSLAISTYMAARAYHYQYIVEDYLDNTEFVTPPYTKEDEGSYPESAKAYLDDARFAIDNVLSNYTTLTPKQIDALYEQIEALIAQFEGATLRFSTFPTIVDNISAATSTAYPNNAVWRSNEIVLDKAVDGIRLTFLERHLGTAGDSGDWPMIALGELKLYDMNGDEVTLTEENLVANYTETQEGFESTVARLVDGVWGQGDGVTEDGGKAAGSYYHSPWSTAEPQEFIYVEITFPEPMDVFTVELYSRDKSTSNGAVSLFPKKLAITENGVGYDPLLFAENPYNVLVGEQVTDASQITADGIYLIKGLLNTSAKYGVDAETGLPTGDAKFYEGTSRFHASPDAVRANCVFRIVPNGDGTFSIISLKEAKYWPSSEGTGFVSSTLSKGSAAKVKIVPANTEFASSFVMYEEHADLTVGGDSIDTDGDEVADAVSAVVSTPYVVYMDWYSGLATRPVVKALPREGLAEDVKDAWGDSLNFNKGNGEGEWQIFKVKMDNPDFYWLTNMVGVVDGLGLVQGNDPGCVSDLGELGAALEAAQNCVADSAYADAPAVAKALSEKIELAEKLEKNPMKPGVYMITSAYTEYFKQQGKTRSMFITVDAEFGSGTGLRWGDTPAAGDIKYYFDFQISPDASALVDAGTIPDTLANSVYSIRAIGTTEAEVPYYIGEVDAQSTQIDLVSEWWSNYLVLPSTGSAFNIQLAGHENFNLHSNGHGSGAGNNGNIVYWTASPGASQWRLVAVDYETSIEDLVAEGDEVVSVAYYTVGGAASSTPAKGVNIVRIVYANGVVETKKLFVK